MPSPADSSPPPWRLQSCGSWRSGSVSLGWARPDGASASLALRYAGPQYEDDLNRQPIPEALTGDAAIAWPLTRVLMVELRGENIGDEEVVAGVTGDGVIERAAPRTIWLGLRLRG